MTAQNSNAAARVEAVQAVIDRVVSWQDGAPEGTVRDELAKGMREAGVEVPDSLLDELAQLIHDDTDRIEAAELIEAHEDAVERRD